MKIKNVLFFSLLPVALFITCNIYNVVVEPMSLQMTEIFVIMMSALWIVVWMTGSNENKVVQQNVAELLA